MQHWYDNFPKEKRYWPDRHYASLLQSDDNKTFTFTYEDRIDLINRAAEYFWCTYMPKVLSDTPATQYLMSLADSESGRTTLSSYDLDKMAKNPDGSITLYVGPTAPPGKENNWIPTSGKRPLPAMRFYGPTDELNHKTFKLADFERV